MSWGGLPYGHLVVLRRQRQLRLHPHLVLILSRFASAVPAKSKTKKKTSSPSFVVVWKLEIMSQCREEAHDHGHSHSHGGGGGGDDHHEHHGHDHDHESYERGVEFSLYKYIDTSKVICLNRKDDGKPIACFKAWANRMDKSSVSSPSWMDSESTFCTSMSPILSLSLSTVCCPCWL